jgi:PST family polysaccharide transporter
VAVVLVTLSPAVVHVLYGAHWAPAAAALQFLAFVMVARMFTALVFDIQTGLGNTKVTVVLNLVWLTALLPALWIGARTGGMRGAAIGHAIVALVVAIPLAGLLLHRAGVHMGPVLGRLVRPVSSGIAAGLVMAGMSQVMGSAYAQLFVAGGLGLAVYALLAVPADVRVRSGHRMVAMVSARRGAPA